MNKKIAVILACIPIFALIGIALAFAFQGINGSRDVILSYTPLIGISNAIVALAAIAPFIFRIYHNMPLIEIDYSQHFYYVNDQHFMLFRIINYGQSEAANPSLRILHFKDNISYEIYNKKFRYTLLTGQYFNFYLTSSIDNFKPNKKDVFIAEITYSFFFRRKAIFIPFGLTEKTIHNKDLKTNETIRTDIFLTPSCLDYDKSKGIINRHLANKSGKSESH